MVSSCKNEVKGFQPCLPFAPCPTEQATPHAIWNTATTTPKASASGANGKAGERRCSAWQGKFSRNNSRVCARASIHKVVNSSDNATAESRADKLVEIST